MNKISYRKKILQTFIINSYMLRLLYYASSEYIFCLVLLDQQNCNVYANVIQKLSYRNCSPCVSYFWKLPFLCISDKIYDDFITIKPALFGYLKHSESYVCSAACKNFTNTIGLFLKDVAKLWMISHQWSSVVKGIISDNILS